MKNLKSQVSLSILVLIFIVSISFTYCKKKQEEGTPLVRVGDKIITKEEVDRSWMALPDWMKTQYMDRQGRKNLLDALVSWELLCQEAHRQGIDEEPAVKDRIEKMRRNIIAEEVINRSLNMEDLYRYYQEDFIKLQALSFPVSQEAGSKEDSIQRAKAFGAYEQIRSGKSFQDVAKNLGQTVEPGFYISREFLIENYGSEIADNLFSLKKENEITPPLRGRDGYYIFKVIELPGNLDPRGYEAVVDQIVEVKQEDIFKGYINELRSRIKVEWHQKNLEEFLSLGDQYEKMQRELEKQEQGSEALKGGTADEKPREPQGLTSPEKPKELQSQTSEGK